MRPRLGAGNLSLAQRFRHRPRYPQLEHALRLVAFALAVIGGLAGLVVMWMHLTSDPIADAHAYYDAARRLNEGQALYPAGADPNSSSIYLYPPLLAIALRPLALLPYDAFAVIWEAFIVATFLYLVYRQGPGPRIWVAIGILGIPVGWALAVGQAHVPLTLLVAIGQPWSIALAANLKVFPALIVLWWIGRRQWQTVVAFGFWLLILAIIQVILEPHASGAFFNSVGAAQIGDKRSFSPWELSPWLWASLVLVGALVTVGLARTRAGWPAAVTFSTLASPLLLVYMLIELLAGLREPRIAGEPDPNAPLTAAESLVRSAR